ncbi:RDD family protein [Ammoniphilus sp. 3BR4]|uniref:RDD family protein n=1 Tax=Ammoniphilus sp. 3BR4 TaxID=3158265 RepID=UPI003466BEAB
MKWKPSIRQWTAGFWVRFVALLIDSIIISAPFGMAFYVWGVEENFTTEALSKLVSFLYPLLVPVFWRGYTVGKKVMGVRIVKVNGEKVGMGTMLKRNLVGGLVYIFTFGIAVIVTAFMVGLREDRRAIHDLIAGTYVTKS